MAVSCRAAGLRFLKLRPRSVKELEEKLKGKGFAAGAIQETIGYLKQARLLDDRVLTEGWIRYRMTRPFGFQRIIRELQEKGVEEGIITAAIARARSGYSEEDVAVSLAQRRAERLTGIDPVKKKKRILDFLVRRGFPIDIVDRIIKEV